MDKFSDKEVLFEGLKVQDHWAQKVFFNAVFPRLCKYSLKIVGNREDAEDVAIDRLHECFRKAHKKNSYAHLVGQLFIATRNKSINDWRDGKLRRRRIDSTDLDEMADNATLNEIMRYEIEEDLREHLSDETEMNLAVAQMAFAEGMSNQEIAELLGITEKSVRDRKSRMRPGLKDAFLKGGLFIFLLISTKSTPCGGMKFFLKKTVFPVRQNTVKPGVVDSKHLINQAINTYQYDANQHLNH